MIITQNGEAKVVLQDVRVYEQQQESLALLKILALSNKSLNEGKAKIASEEKCSSLSELDRDHFPPELERIGILEYREINFKPYRIIYQGVDSKVCIHCVLDGCRELQKLLENRLLR